MNKCYAKRPSTGPHELDPTVLDPLEVQLCLVTQWYPTLCDPVDCSPAGSSVHGILLARILEWVAMPSSRGYSQPRDQTCFLPLLPWQVGSLPLGLPGKHEPIWVGFSVTYIQRVLTNIAWGFFPWGKTLKIH